MTAMQSLITKIIAQHNQTAAFNDPAGHPEFLLKLDPPGPGYMRLVIERLYAPDHGCQVVSVAHYYTQNGDPMRDPEMCFDFTDWRPLYYRQDGLGLEQYVYTDPTRQRYRPALAKSLRSFAATWAHNLHAQGFDRTPAGAQ